MNKRLSKIINENQIKFEEWHQILKNHQKKIFENSHYTSDPETLFDKTLKTILKISDLAIKYGNFKDEFDNSKMELDLYGPRIIIESKKTGILLYLGIDLNGMYLEMDFMNGQNLKKMDDEFWIYFFKLKEYKGFEYQEISHFENSVKKKYPELFDTNKSEIFLMHRKYFITITENQNDFNLGSIAINWKYSDSFENVFSEICTSFKLMYKLNYKLWKIEDLKLKRKLSTKFK